MEALRQTDGFGHAFPQFLCGFSAGGGAREIPHAGPAAEHRGELERARLDVRRSARFHFQLQKRTNLLSFRSGELRFKAGAVVPWECASE